VSEVHVAGRGRRSCLAEVERVDLGAEANDREPTAAEIPRTRMDDGERERGRHSGVYRIPTLAEDLKSDLGRGPLGTRHGSPRAADGLRVRALERCDRDQGRYEGDDA
jgi:hypothetical protein